MPEQLKALLESDGVGRAVEIQMRLGGHLEDLAMQPKVVNLIAKGGWDVVVLQGAQISMSHSRDYPQDGTVELAKLARRSGSRALYFAEFPRRGVDETNYIFGVYQKDAAESQAEVVPIGHIWDEVVRKVPGIRAWMADGNHETPTGAFIVAYGFYVWLAGSSRAPRFHPSEVDASTAALIRRTARGVIAKAARR